MTVEELIKHLEKMGTKREVKLYWDGAPRGEVEAICFDDGNEVHLIGEWDRTTKTKYSDEEIVFENVEMERWSWEL